VKRNLVLAQRRLELVLGELVTLDAAVSAVSCGFAYLDSDVEFDSADEAVKVQVEAVDFERVGDWFGLRPPVGKPGDQVASRSGWSEFPGVELVPVFLFCGYDELARQLEINGQVAS
jgi:hypothetical protein